MDNTHRIVQGKGHYEVHDSNGNFVLSKAESRMENIRERVSA